MDQDSKNKINLRLLLLKTQVTKTYVQCQKLENNFSQLNKEQISLLQKEILDIDNCLNKLKSTLSVELNEQELDLESLMDSTLT